MKRLLLVLLVLSLFPWTQLAQEESISFETSLPVSSEIRLEINAQGKVTVEGLRHLRDEEVQGITFSYYVLLSQSVILKGTILGLDCSHQEVTQLDLSRALSLKTLFAYKNKLTEIDLARSTALDFVDLSYNELVDLAIPSLPKLQRLSLYSNKLSKLSIGSCPQLNYLDIHSNELSQAVCDELVSCLPRRTDTGTLVAVDNTQQEGNRCSMKAVKVAKERGWDVFDYNGSPFSLKPYRGFDYVPQVSERNITLISAKPQMSEISISIKTEEPYRVEGAELLSEKASYDGDKHLQLRLGDSGEVRLYGDILYLDCSNVGLTQILFTNESLISSLVCRDNELERLDLSQASHLKQLDCRNNKLAQLQLSPELPLLYLSVASNNLSDAEVTSLIGMLAKGDDTNLVKKAIIFDCTKEGEGNLFSVEATRELKRKGFTPLAIINDEEKLIYYRGWNYRPHISQGEGVVFSTSRAIGEKLLIEMAPVSGEDYAVSGASLLYLDAPGETPYEVYRVDNATITISGRLAKLDLGDCGVTALDCTKAPSLISLLLVNNPELCELELSATKLLETLQIVGCGISTIDIRHLTELRQLYAGYSALHEIELSHCRKLETINLDKLQLTVLNLANNKNLKSLSCSENKLTELDLSAQQSLEDLDCSHNALMLLRLPQTAPLVRMDASHNKLQSLTLGSYPHLQQLSCYGNEIDTLHAGGLFESLPSRPGGSRGRFLFCDSSIPTEGNIAYQRDVERGVEKSWLVLDFNGSPMRAKQYKGVPNPNQVQAPPHQVWRIAQVGQELQILNLPTGELFELFSLTGVLLYRGVVQEDVSSVDTSSYPLQIIVSAMGQSRVVVLSREA